MKAFLVAISILAIFRGDSIYKFKVDSLDGGSINLKSDKGKKILIVNTASKSGIPSSMLTLKNCIIPIKSKLLIIGFPTNNYGLQAIIKYKKIFHS